MVESGDKVTVFANTTHFSTWTVLSSSDTETEESDNTPGFGIISLFLILGLLSIIKIKTIKRT
jgi:hypothetical protein